MLRNLQAEQRPGQVTQDFCVRLQRQEKRRRINHLNSGAAAAAAVRPELMERPLLCTCQFGAYLHAQG